MSEIHLKASDQDYLTGQLLIAMPNLQDGCFDRSVVLMLSHDDNHAMGLIINREIVDLSFSQVLSQLSIEPSPQSESLAVNFGGPVDTKKGIVLHSTDYQTEGTEEVVKGVLLSTSLNILRQINDKSMSDVKSFPPRESILCMGHAGWSAGQLESEISQNAWLNVDAEPELVFKTPQDKIWECALAKLGFTPGMLSAEWADFRDPDTPLN